jgi:hypothetical protein
MKIGLFNNKLVEEIGGTYDPVVFLNVLKDEDKNKCPHCGKPIPTEIVSVVSSRNHQAGVKQVESLTKNAS